MSAIPIPDGIAGSLPRAGDMSLIASWLLDERRLPASDQTFLISIRDQAESIEGFT